MKVAILFHRFGPYHHARLRALGTRCELTAIELSAVDNTYAWAPVAGSVGFSRVTLFRDADVEDKTTEEVRHALWHTLDEYRPQAVALPGWGNKPSLLALEWCRQNDIPAIMLSASTAVDDIRLPWKEWAKSQIVSQCGSGLVGGRRHVDYLVQLSMARERIFVGYDVIDNNYFSRGAALTRGRAEALRVDHALPSKYFLNSSRFVEKKNLPKLIEAYAKYRALAGKGAWHLVVIGDGPLRPQLEEQIGRLGLNSHVHLLGFKQYDELPIYYGLAEAYIQPSTTEQWGLVVNEAMACGLPVLVSDRCGCAPDLVRQGVNGYVFDSFDVDGLAELMTKLSADEKVLAEMGEASREIIAHWTPDIFAENLLKAAQSACANPLPKISWFDRMLLRGLIRR